MTAVDFRSFAFDAKRIDKTANYVGRGPYARLYAAENLIRVMIHSVLIVQIGPDWWLTAVSPGLQKQASDFAKRHAAKPWYSSPGAHGLYYLFLHDLAEVMRANAHLLASYVPDIDSWLSKIEDVRIPRNVICHMNFPTKTDRQRLEVFYSDLRNLLVGIAAAGVTIKVP